MFSNIKERNSWLAVALLKPSEYSDKQVSSNIYKKEKKVEKDVPVDISWWTWKGGPPTRK